MIKYGGGCFLTDAFQVSGSVFPNAFAAAFPAALIAAGLFVLIDRGYLPAFEGETSIVKEPQAWSGFNFLVGFAVVFRTSQAYNRFWSGCTATHAMRAEWFDSCCSIVSFTRYTNYPKEDIVEFKNKLIRLFSMLHASALAELEVMNSEYTDDADVHSYTFDLIDPAGIDEASLRALKDSDCKVELLFAWIQSLLVDSMKSGLLNIPPPVMSRAFQEFANGMVAFHDAVKITYVPFPFPYAQTCALLLILHWFIVPFVTAHWVTSPYWAACFVFCQVFILWSLNAIAIEIENPFGNDANDLDGCDMQKEMNAQLLMLLKMSTDMVPTMTSDAYMIDPLDPTACDVNSFNEVWEMFADNGQQAPAVSARTKNGEFFNHHCQSRGHSVFHKSPTKRFSQFSTPTHSHVPIRQRRSGRSSVGCASMPMGDKPSMEEKKLQRMYSENSFHGVMDASTGPSAGARPLQQPNASAAPAVELAQEIAIVLIKQQQDADEETRRSLRASEIRSRELMEHLQRFVSPQIMSTVTSCTSPPRLSPDGAAESSLPVGEVHGHSGLANSDLGPEVTAPNSRVGPETIPPHQHEQEKDPPEQTCGLPGTLADTRQGSLLE